MKTCKTTCPYCGVGCGVQATIDKGKVIAVMGDGDHPANAGRLCVKGTALSETLSREGRLLHPSYRGTRMGWDDSLDLLAARLRQTRQEYGPGAIAFYLSGQLLTEDYYVANKLMKGFLGSANVDTNSRLCMSSAVAGYKRAFGADFVPCSYTDLESCELLLMVGSNAAWTHPVVYQRIAQSKKDNPDKKIVVVDTRRTATCDIADLHLQLAPGSDGFLFAGLLHYLAQNDHLDREYIRDHTTGIDAALAEASELELPAVASATGLGMGELRTFYEWFASTRTTVTLYSQGINQSATGADKCNAIINCHLATGRLGHPGMGPFSITGQPNAMGGREVGGLAHQLAAHMDFDPEAIDRVRRFWGATDMAGEAGLKAIDMFRAAADGKIRFLWIMGTNPAVSLPDTDLVRKALARCEFVAVSDCTAATDTTAYADLLLPARGWGEKDGTVTNSERCISRQRKLVDPQGEARPDWWIVSQVAGRLGFGDAFSYRRPSDIFAEHAALSAYENAGRRDFDIGALQQLSAEDYDEMEPRYWPLPAEYSDATPLRNGRFFTSDGSARFIAVQPALPESSATCQTGLVLNTGRLRDQWHTMTRTGGVPRLMRHRDFLQVSINPVDAAARSIDDGELVEISNARGDMRALARLEDTVPPGQVFAPIHWSDQFAARACVSRLIAPLTDPVSGQPQSKYARVEITGLQTDFWGLLFSREPVAMPASLAFWSRSAVAGGVLTLLAGERGSGDEEIPGQALLDTMCQTDLQRVEFSDAASGDYREVGCRDGSLHHALFLHRRRDALPDGDWFQCLPIEEQLEDPALLLAGLDPAVEDSGRLVCSCWEVGEKQIDRAICAGAASVEALGRELRCGTRCGSCLPELRQLLGSAREGRAA